MKKGIQIGNKEPIKMSELDEFAQELTSRLQKLSLNVIQESEVESSEEDFTNTLNILYSSLKPYYKCPTPVDIQFEDDVPIRDYFDGRALIEWNLDGYSEYQIYQLLYQMLIYATACKSHGNPEKGIVQAIVASFQGN